MKLTDILNESVPAPNDILKSLDFSSYDSFLNSIKKLPKDQVTRLNTFLTNLRKRTYRQKAGGSTTVLYHGTPSKYADKIRQDGFKLTQGHRQGLMGATKLVDNQGIFLTDSKPLARYFGSNRSDHPQDFEILTVYGNTSKVLDVSVEVPADVKKMGLDIVNTYNKTSNTKIPQREWWWLLDQPQFVQFLKDNGYTGIKFKEDSKTLKMAQDSNAFTYLMFDPRKLAVAGGVDTVTTIKDFYLYLLKNLSLDTLKSDSTPVTVHA